MLAQVEPVLAAVPEERVVAGLGLELDCTYRCPTRIVALGNPLWL